ncbi:MAG: TMEM165/GDT1 family protein [Pseudomonadales bacterium]|nr:TMEM165/GDT1 family protein [Pseudomonadales bacterium]
MDALLTSTLTVALAEIGDKTQLLSLFLAARYRNKWAIIAGILLATLLNHAASAWLGSWLGQFFQSQIGEWLIGASFILLGLWLLVPDKDEGGDSRFSQYGAFTVSCLLFFLAEIGDKTQVATILLAAEFQSVLWVTLGTTLGMLAANVPVVFAGDYLMRRIPLTLVRVLASLAFIVFGIFSLLG